MKQIHNNNSNNNNNNNPHYKNYQFLMYQMIIKYTSNLIKYWEKDKIYSFKQRTI